MAGFFSLLRRLYLTAYNFTFFFADLHKPLLFAQTAAVLEILHGIVGLVRSSVTATFPQIGSRLFLAWGILCLLPPYQSAGLSPSPHEILDQFRHCLVHE
ncbi:Very-long-chain (3R)-3-hydroxyacyl-CoA dehydratase PASTICCINO 2 [Glycine soja]|uniref:Very-long-chain (3R)-3-hydroxyacyl-CoA dehydratase n=1 Tax=Glycine soja TaxID=3848 RepID=A0A445LXT9_GLYSO|nr:Very-long-chain (3R)-3-hydroxyacyl-CoA dehydratase PASTICCINO 2 [Glycine soja]